MKTENRIEVALPFCGFYESALSYEIEKELEYIFNLECGYGDVPDEIHNQIDYGKVHQSLASDYVKAFENWLANKHGIEIDLDFVEMTWPREYNFKIGRAHV